MSEELEAYIEDGGDDVEGMTKELKSEAEKSVNSIIEEFAKIEIPRAARMHDMYHKFIIEKDNDLKKELENKYYREATGDNFIPLIKFIFEKYYTENKS